MGGSLARALKGLVEPPHVSGLTLFDEDLSAALEAGVVDQGCRHPEELLAGSDLVVLCMPLVATLEFLRRNRKAFREQTLLTDVVSLKEPVLMEVGTLGLEGFFVGSHPMAGGEGTGFSASRDDLYEDARVWVCPGEASPEAVSGVVSFWTELGGSPQRIDARDHDELMTWVSHLPQLVSSALGSVYDRHAVERGVLGPGGRDMTRLAGSSPDMWIELLAKAPESLQVGLREVEVVLAGIRNALRSGDVREARSLMENSQKWFRGGS